MTSPQHSCHRQSSGSNVAACRNGRLNTTSFWLESPWSLPSCKVERGNHPLCPHPLRLHRGEQNTQTWPTLLKLTIVKITTSNSFGPYFIKIVALDFNIPTYHCMIGTKANDTNVLQFTWKFYTILSTAGQSIVPLKNKKFSWHFIFYQK